MADHGRQLSSEDRQLLCQVFADDLSMLAALHDREPDGVMLRSLREQEFPDGLGLGLISDQGGQAVEFLRQALNGIPEVPDQALLDELAADFANIYLNFGVQASPEESVWIDDENLTCQDSMFQVRNWYARHGLGAADWRVRPDDHLVLELRFLSHLFAGEATLKRLREAARFMDEHLLRWLGQFAQRVAGRCDTAYFAGVAMLTGAYCEELRDLLAIILNEPRPSQEEIDERMRPRRPVEEVPVRFMPGIGPAV